MHFAPTIRTNPETRQREAYFRLKETYRDSAGVVRSRILLSPGFIKDYAQKDLCLVAKVLTFMVAPALYSIKDKLETFLCQKTDGLFDLTNRIALFDLANFYYEGRKDQSKKAAFGRSKEKRNDCKLLVLALCINTDGFIRYSSILEGNTSDPASLPDMIEALVAKNPVVSNTDEKGLVVIDAGIASEENLKLIKEKGYNYLCVSRK